MCGIAGILCNKIGTRELGMATEMRELLQHRGPDDWGLWISDEKKAVLVHRRLSILDLSVTGKQPMVSRGERFVISYNGEIYNYIELASKLKRERNLSFLGTSDTEVLLNCFEEYGVDETLALCKGMFAIALYDRKEQILTLVRDRMGEKPLYYGRISDIFVFASELECLYSISQNSLSINYNALGEFISRGFISGDRTIYDNIYKLRPGELLSIDSKLNIVRQCSYWNYKDIILSGYNPSSILSLEEASAQLETLLTDSVAGQMLSDVPIGAFLSSGVDSSLIVAIMQKINSAKIKTFSIGVEDSVMNEARDSKKIAERLGTDHTELYISEKEIKDVIPMLPKFYSEPFGDSSAIPSILVSRFAKTKVSVALTGDGGDELFGGYPWYQYRFLPREWRIIRKIPLGLRTVLSRKILENTWCMRHTKMAKRGDWLQADSIETLYDIMRYGILSLSDEKWCVDGSGNRLPSNVEGIENISETMMYLDAISYLPDDVLVKMDRAAMSCSLETRAPFLDRDVVQFAGKINLKHKLNKQGDNKIILRKILSQYIPEHLISPQKKGFSIPISKWLLTDKKINDWANTLLDAQNIKKQNVLNVEMVQKVWNEFNECGKYSVQVWNLLMFEAWFENKKLLEKSK